MAGFIDRADPNIKPGEYPKCEAGIYEVNGFEWMKPDNDTPIYVPDKFRGTSVPIRFNRVDGGVQPPYSLTALEMTLLVKAFGGDVTKLPKNRDTSEFLIACEDMIRASKKTVKVIVSDRGWVNSVEGAVPPEGFYQFKVTGARSIDGKEPVHFTQTEYDQKAMIINFEIVGSISGKPTIFNGYEVQTWVYDPFNGSENNLPLLAVTKAGGKPMNVVRMERFIKAFCPEIFEYDWASAATSKYGIDEYDNPIVVIIDQAVKNGKKVVGQFAPNKNGKMALDLKSLSIEPEAEEEEVKDVPELNLFEKEHPMLKAFADHVISKCSDAFTVYPVDDISKLALSDAGKAWANTDNTLINLWKDAKIESQAKPIQKITEEEAGKLMSVVWGNNFS